MTEYKIKSLKDLLNVLIDRIDDCLDELKDGLKLMHSQIDSLNVPMKDVEFHEFTWKDDGAKNITSNLNFAGGNAVQVKVDRND